MNNKIDELGVEWFDVDASRASQKWRHTDFVSLPATGLRSPELPGRAPLIKHEAGANGPVDRQIMVQQRHAQFLEGKIQQWGPCSPYTTDWDALLSATNDLVKGVINGDIGLVRQALANHADPGMTVSVLDPNSLTQDPSHPQYVALPIGVAALLRGKEVATQSGNKADQAPFKEIGQLLLMDGATPRVSVGASPDGVGSALGYQAFGVKVYGDEAGMESLEHRVVSIPLSVYNLVGAAVPMAMVDNRIEPATNGVVWGEDLPSDARNNYMDLLDPQEDSIKDSIQRFRQRRATASRPSSPKMK